MKCLLIVNPAFGLAGLLSFANYGHPPIEVLVDGKIVDRGSFVMVSNTRLYGAFLPFTRGRVR